MRVLFTGGGTGGHVYPALSVIERLRSDPGYGIEAEGIAWVGRNEGMERDIIERQGLAYLPIAAGALRGRGPWAILQSLARLARGIWQGRRLLRRWQAAAVFATGGYVTAPLVVAAWLSKRPVLIYLPDMEPGLAVRVLSRFATCIAVTVEQVARFFPPERVSVTGYPVRRGLLTANRFEARRRLGLGSGRPVLLILGGSSGAHSINMAVNRDLEGLLALAQVVHISGPLDHEALQARRARLPEALQAEYHLAAYLHDEMVAALASADLVVARAGAATLGEFPAVGLPAVLVPLPHAGQFQHPNADYLAERGAAAVLEDDALAADFAETVAALLNDPSRLARMSEAARQLSVDDGAERLASLLADLAKGYSHE
jgi:UDP-N-acetylglucosamine--N-acetylmuramyl-(pentapeptide) pyrophosphoryl-undecaprenol N-acetylglucosamine transferase